MDVPTLSRLWIVEDYLPQLLGEHTDRFCPIERLCELIPNGRVDVLPAPRDCTDQFLSALWGRPHALLDPATRAATSPWYDLAPDIVDAALDRLRRDLETGAWHDRYGHLLELSELDVGLRLVTGEISEG